MNRIHLTGLVALIAVGATAGLQACSDDENVASPGDAGFDSAATVDTGAPPADGGTDSGVAITTFAVPAGGGSIDIPSAAGKITFTFPASAGGKTITFAPSSAAAIGWAADQFVDAIKMGPDGTRFTDPVVVKIEKKDLVGMVLTFGDAAQKGLPSPLTYDATAGGFELLHFTTLVIVPPGKMCDSQGSNDTAASGRCADAGAATTFRTVTCKGYNFCMTVNAACCVDPSVDSGATCSTEQQLYGITYTPTESTNGGQYPYCEVDAGNWDGGPDAGQGCTSPAYFGYTLNTQNAGCSLVRDCGPIYRLDCNGTTCSCMTQNPQNPGTPFPQDGVCDTAATMKSAYVQRCNFPTQ